MNVNDAGHGDRIMQPITRAQALDKLAAAPFGRIVFTERALPALRTVNHIVQDGRIIIRSHPGSTVTSHAGHEMSTVVLYQADDINPGTRTGWTVTVTGYAVLIVDPAQAAVYASLIRPWVAGPKTQIIAIDPQIVDGYQLIPQHAVEPC